MCGIRETALITQQAPRPATTTPQKNARSGMSGPVSGTGNTLVGTCRPIARASPGRSRPTPAMATSAMKSPRSPYTVRMAQWG